MIDTVFLAIGAVSLFSVNPERKQSAIIQRVDSVVDYLIIPSPLRDSEAMARALDGHGWRATSAERLAEGARFVIVPRYRALRYELVIE